MEVQYHEPLPTLSHFASKILSKKAQKTDSSSKRKNYEHNKNDLKHYWR